MNENLHEVFLNEWFEGEKIPGDFFIFYDKQNEGKTKMSKYLESNYVNKYGNQGSVQVKSINENKNVMYSRRSGS